MSLLTLSLKSLFRIAGTAVEKQTRLAVDATSLGTVVPSVSTKIGNLTTGSAGSRPVTTLLPPPPVHLREPTPITAQVHLGRLL